MSRVDVSQLEAAVRDYSEEKARQLGEQFVEVLRDHMPRRSGALAASAEVESVEVTARGASARIVVGAEYAVWVNEGTGIYGPDGVPIEPRRPGGVLVFDWPAAGGIVFTRRVSGSEPTHYWERTLEAWPAIVGAV